MAKVAKRLVGIVLMIGLALGLSHSVTLAQEEAEAKAPQAAPVVNTYEVMETLFEPLFDELDLAMQEEPVSRGDWRDIRQNAYATAEVTNLLFFRDDLDYVTSQEWKEHTVSARESAKALGDAAREKDFTLVKEKWTAMIQSCNACHEKFEPDLAPVFELPGEEAAAE